MADRPSNTHASPFALWLKLTLTKLYGEVHRPLGVIIQKLSWASLVAQMVKHLPARWETQVRSLGREDPLKNEMELTLVLLPGKFHGWRRLVCYSPWGHKEWDMTGWLHFTDFWFPSSISMIHWFTWKLGSSWIMHTFRIQIHACLNYGSLFGFQGPLLENPPWNRWTWNPEMRIKNWNVSDNQMVDLQNSHTQICVS